MTAGPAPGGAPARFLRRLGQLELAVAVVAFLGVVSLVVAQVVLRYGFDRGIVWAQELAQLLMLACYFVGIGYVYKARQDVLITMVIDRFSRRARLACYLGAQALTAAFGLMLFVALIEIAPMQLRMRTYILQIPRFYSSLPLLIGSASMTLTALYYGIGLALASRAEPGLDVAALEDRLALFARPRPDAAA